MSNEMEVIDLDRMVKPVARVRLLGKERDILPASGRVADLLEQIQRREKGGEANGITVIGVMREIARECVPSLSADEIARMNFDQISAVVGLSTGRIDEMKAMIAEYEKNGEVPVKKLPTTPALKSSTLSAPPSSRSRGR